MFTISDASIIDCVLELPRIGAWTSEDVTIDTEIPFNIGDSVTMKFTNTEFKGTILDTGVFQGFQRCSIIGGSGQMSDKLESTPYNGTTIRQIVNDIARKTNHTLSLESNEEILDTNLLSWNIIQMKASQALTRLLKEVSAIWRILPDGTLWVGKEEYVNDINSGDFEIIEKHPEDSIWEVYNEEYLIQPLNLFDGNTVTHITYRVSGGELTIFLNFTDTYADTTDDLTNQDDEIVYNGLYRCAVVSQHSDGTLDLLPSPYLERIKNGFVNVPINYPFPGMKILVPNNTICRVGFDNGDPQYPIVIGWNDTGAASKVEFIHTSAQPAARKTDKVDCGSITLVGMISGTYTFPVTTPPHVPPTTAIAPGVPFSMEGIITTGSSVVSIGT